MTNAVTLITTFLFLLAAAIGGGVIAIRLRLPSILGYIAGGIVIGWLFSRIINHQVVDTVAQSGITLLSFAMGIEFSFHKLRRILRAISWLTVGQILFTLFLMMVLLISFRTGLIASLYLGTAVAVSSTAIVVKLLSERGELDSVPGEVGAGWLVVQDIAVIPLLILLTAVSSPVVANGTVFTTITTVLWAIGKAGIFLAVLLYLGRVGVPRLLSAVAGMKNRELLLLTTIGIVFFVGLATYAAGLSIALGAFIAGLLVSDTSQNHAVFSEIRPLRDLFAVVFFVSLGMSLPIDTFVSLFPVILALTAAVCIVKAAVTYGLLRFMGYHRKTAFLVGLYVIPVSEFGFVLARSGVSSGALNTTHMTILIAVTFLTIMVSAPLITHGHDLYYQFADILKKFPKLFPETSRESEFPHDTSFPIAEHVIICGYGRVGKYIGRALEMAGVPFLVIDYNQATLKTLHESGIQSVYGDPADKDVLQYASVRSAKAIVVAIPDRHTQEMVIGNALSLNRKIKIICRTHHEEDQRHLKSLGVQIVIQPEFEAALTIVNKLLSDFGVPEEELAGKMSRLKIEHGITS